MKSKTIKRIFDEFFRYPNPIFCIPICYFKHDRFLCEIAMTKSLSDMRWNNCPFTIKNPLLIFEGLFVDDGCYVTVLEKTSKGKYVHRTDLCNHLSDWRKELNPFIWKLK